MTTARPMKDVEEGTPLMIDGEELVVTSVNTNTEGTKAKIWAEQEDPSFVEYLEEQDYLWPSTMVGECTDSIFDAVLRSSGTLLAIAHGELDGLLNDPNVEVCNIGNNKLRLRDNRDS